MVLLSYYNTFRETNSQKYFIYQLKKDKKGIFLHLFVLISNIFPTFAICNNNRKNII